MDVAEALGGNRIEIPIGPSMWGGSILDQALKDVRALACAVAEYI